MDGMSVQAQEARRDYKRRYRIRNREKINDQQRAWRKNNPEKVREYQAQYWERKAGKTNNIRANIRASWKDYGITQERVDELVEIVRSGKYDDLVRSAALMADELAAGHILLSVSENLSYERIEFDEKLGRCPLGKTDFYGARRLFFHQLNCALSGKKTAAREGRHG